MQMPSLGRIVRYVGKQGINAPRAAIVTCSQADIVPGGDVVPLDSPTHVHLHVFTPSQLDGFPEFNIPYDESGAPGTWSWPPVVKPEIPDTPANRAQAWIEGDDSTRKPAPPKE